MEGKKLARKLAYAIGVAAVQNHCSKRRALAVTLPEITPVWMEQTIAWNNGHQAGPHILSRNSIRWMA